MIDRNLYEGLLDDELSKDLIYSFVFQHVENRLVSKFKKNTLKLIRVFQIINENDTIIGASDAFFPFVDGIETLVQNGVSAIIQPSGSIRDKEIIKFADKLGVILVFTTTRHFKH